MKKEQPLLDFGRCLDPDPVFTKCMDPVCPERLDSDPDSDPVCPERLDPDPSQYQTGSLTLALVAVITTFSGSRLPLFNSYVLPCVGGRNLLPTMDINISGLEVLVEDEVSGLWALLLPLCRGMQGVRCEVAFSPTFGATPKTLSVTPNFEA